MMQVYVYLQIPVYNCKKHRSFGWIKFCPTRGGEAQVTARKKGICLEFWAVGFFYKSLIASSLGMATIVSVVTVSAAPMDSFIASFSFGASSIITVS